MPNEAKKGGSTDVGKIKSKAELIARFTPASTGGYQRPTPTGERRKSLDPDVVRARVAAMVRERSVSPSRRDAYGTPNTFVPLTPESNQRRKIKPAANPNVVREKVAARVRERSQSPSRRNSGFGISTFVDVTPSGPIEMQKKKVTVERKPKVLSNWPPREKGDSDIQKLTSNSSVTDQAPTSQSSPQNVEGASQRSAQESDESSFFPFASDKATKKNKSLFNRFNVLAGKKKKTKDSPAQEKGSAEGEMSPKPASANSPSKLPKQVKKKSKNTAKVSESAAIPAPTAVQEDNDLVSPTEDGEKRVNYRVRYQGKTNLPLNELYGNREALAGESEQKKGPNVWMTPLLVEDEERAWMLKRVWDDDDLDELEQGHTVQETELMGALKSLLGVPDLDDSWRGDDSNQNNLPSIPRLSLSEQSSCTWLIQRVDDLDGEVDKSTSRSDEDRLDHKQMEEQIKEITEKAEHHVGISSDPGQEADTANIQTQKVPEREGRSRRRGRKPGKRRPRKARRDDLEEGDAPIERRRSTSADPTQQRQINDKGRILVKSKAAQIPMGPEREGRSLSQKRRKQKQVTREIEAKPTNMKDNVLVDGAYYYNPEYRIKPKSKEPDGQRYDYKVKGKWLLPFDPDKIVNVISTPIKS